MPKKQRFRSRSAASIILGFRVGLAFFAEFAAPLGDAGFGYAILCGDTFVGSSLFLMEADRRMKNYGRRSRS